MNNEENKSGQELSLNALEKANILMPIILLFKYIEKIIKKGDD